MHVTAQKNPTTILLGKPESLLRKAQVRKNLKYKAVFGSRKIISGKYAIFRKGKRFHVFGCHKIHFTEN